MLTLVLLPGMDGTGILFEPFIRAFGAEFSTQVISYPTDQFLDYSQLQPFVSDLLPKQGEYVLLGESFSGPIAVSIAATQPSGLIGLILCCTFICNPKPALAPLKFLVDFLPIKKAPFFLINHLLLGSYSTEKLLKNLIDVLGKVSEKVLRARLKAIIDIDVSQKLKLIGIPTLYLQGSEDKLIDCKSATLICNLNVNTYVATLKSPHLLLQVLPRDASIIICNFIKGIDT